MRRVLTVLAAMILLLVGVYLVGPVVPVPTLPAPGTAEQPLLSPALQPGETDCMAAPETRLACIETRIISGESQLPLKPDNEARIVWADPTRKEKTPLSIVFLHGFSASPRELSPTLEGVAARLGANLYLSRLRGHGQQGQYFGRATASEWLNDTELAWQVGRALGDKVLLVGSSTGSSLALIEANVHPETAGVIALSPNFGPKDGTAWMLIRPWGLQLAQLLIGKERSWKPVSPAHDQYWTSRYPVDVLPHMMRIVEMTVALPFESFKVPVACLYTPLDKSLNVDSIVQYCGKLKDPNSRTLVVKSAVDHVLAGDVMGPGSTAEVQSMILDFVASILPGLPLPTQQPTSISTPTSPDGMQGTSPKDATAGGTEGGAATRAETAPSSQPQVGAVPAAEPTPVKSSP